MIRAGMDVEVRGKPGEWMVAGFDGRRVKVVSLDAPGDVQTVSAADLRPIWRPGVNVTEVES